MSKTAAILKELQSMQQSGTPTDERMLELLSLLLAEMQEKSKQLDALDAKTMKLLEQAAEQLEDKKRINAALSFLLTDLHGWPHDELNTMVQEMVARLKCSDEPERPMLKLV